MKIRFIFIIQVNWAFFYNMALIYKNKVLIGLEPMKKVLTVLRNNLSAITPKLYLKFLLE
jgi:hypothetical protein